LAFELDSAMQVLSEVDAGPDLVLFFKHMMVLKGDNAYKLHFNEGDALSASQQGFIEKQFALFNAWYADWSAGLDAKHAA
jgi:4-hydroxy-tetrahydrodipicolinate synthase